METKNIEIVIDGKHSYGVNLQTKLENHIIIAKMHTALMAAIPVELPVILQITKIIDALADEYSNEQKLAYMGNDQKIIRENDIKINTLMELKRVIDKSNLSK